MDIQRTNIINSILFERPSEFKLLIEQSKTPVEKILMGGDGKNILHFLADHNSFEFLKLSIQVFNEQFKNDESNKRQALLEWINCKDSKGLTPLFLAVYRSELVRSQGIHQAVDWLGCWFKHTQSQPTELTAWMHSGEQVGCVCVLEWCDWYQRLLWSANHSIDAG